jgi:hypothetical protein
MVLSLGCGFSSRRLGLAMSLPPDSHAPFGDLVRSPAPPDKPPAPPGKLQYFRAWTFAFDHPQWVVTWLFVTVATLIPVIGQIIVIGYQFAIVEGLHRNAGRSYPEFDLDRFADYLVRGVWVWLVAVVAALAMAPLGLALSVAYFVVVGAASAGGEEVAAATLAIAIAMLALASVVLALLANLVLFPILLRAGLAQDFVAAFHWSWIKSFVFTMWKEMILGTLFLVVSTVVVAAIGTLLCCVGAYPAAALAMIAQSYMYYQYYVLYLQRGGEPVPLKDPLQQGW